MVVESFFAGEGDLYRITDDFWSTVTNNTNVDLAVVFWGEMPTRIPSLVAANSRDTLDRKIANSTGLILSDSVEFTDFLKAHPGPDKNAPHTDVAAWLEELQRQCQYPIIDYYGTAAPPESTAESAWWARLADSPVPGILQGIFPKEPSETDFLTPEGHFDRTSFEEHMEDWQEEVLAAAHALTVKSTVNVKDKLREQLAQRLAAAPLPQRPSPNDFVSVGPGGAVSVRMNEYLQAEQSWRTQFEKTVVAREKIISDTLTASTPEPAETKGREVSLEEGALLSDLLAKRQAQLDSTIRPQQQTHSFVRNELEMP